MHTEKNVFDNIFHTIINSVKSKDTTNSRMDLQALGIMKDLWLKGTRKRLDKIQSYTRAIGTVM